MDDEEKEKWKKKRLEEWDEIFGRLSGSVMVTALVLWNYGGHPEKPGIGYILYEIINIVAVIAVFQLLGEAIYMVVTKPFWDEDSKKRFWKRVRYWVIYTGVFLLFVYFTAYQ